jgi:hypothetical protein
MLALIIIGAIILLISFIMLLPIVFVVDYEKEAEIKVRLLFFDLLKEKKPKKQKPPKKTKTKQKSAKKTQITAQTAPTPSQTRTTAQKPAKKRKKTKKNIPEIDIKLIRIIIDSFAHPFKRLVKKIKITELQIDSIVGGSDAAKAAINYGIQNAALYTTLEWLKAVSTVKTERISIQADFMREDSVFVLHCKVKLKIGTVVLCGLIFLFKFLKHKSDADKPAQQTAKRRKPVNV